MNFYSTVINTTFKVPLTGFFVFNPILIGVGRVSFFLLGSGFGFLILLGSGLGFLIIFSGQKKNFSGHLRVKKIWVRAKLGSKNFAFLIAKI